MYNIYDGFTFVTGLSLTNSRGYYTVGRGEGDYSANFYGLNKNEGVNYPKLLSQLQSKQKFRLNYLNYRGTIVKERKAISRYGVVETGRILNKTIPFTYTNEYKQHRTITNLDCITIMHNGYFIDFRIPMDTVKYASFQNFNIPALINLLNKICTHRLIQRATYQHCYFRSITRKIYRSLTSTISTTNNENMLVLAPLCMV